MPPSLQTSMRIITEPSPEWCARAFCNVPKKKRATHTVTLKAGGKVSVFHVCSTCARRWESERNATVEKIQEEQR